MANPGVVKTNSVCPNCLNEGPHIQLTSRLNIPILQNTVLKNIESARAFKTGQFNAVQCKNCCFVWNEKFDPELLIYDQDYDNDVSASPYYQSHLEKMAHKVINSVPASQPIHYVDVGCGEAGFMKLVKRLAGERCVSAVGFDPSYSETEGPLPDGIQVHRTYFGEEQYSLLTPETNIICSRHTIEHIPKPREFAQVLAKAVINLDAQLFVETPDVDWILTNGAFQDFFFEHCSLFNPNSMSRLFVENGLSSDIEAVYGGQYMWGSFRKPAGKSIVATFENIPCVGLDYQKNEMALINGWKDKIRKYKKSGEIAIWGGASKGVTFTLLINDPEPLITYAIDLNKNKQGQFLPVSGIQVSTPEEVAKHSVSLLIVMNPNYLKEITKQVSSMNWAPTIVCLDENE